MKMRNAITDDFLDVFKDLGKLDIYFNTIIAADPNATIFFYQKRFTQALFSTKGVKGDDFILKLSEKIAPPTAILKYACDNNNISLMYKVYAQKLDDIINALNVVSNNDNYDDVMEILLNNVSGPKAAICIKWLLAISKNQQDPFPRLTKILALKSEQTKTLIQKIMEKIELTTQIVKPTQFVNALVISAEAAKLETNNSVFELISNFANKPGILFIDASLNILIPRIFSGTKEQAEKMLPLLHSIIGMDNITDEFRGKLIPLCEAYEFNDIKHTILLQMKQYEKLISFDINVNLPVFQDINTILVDNRSSKPILESAILENATLLVSKDVDSLVSLIQKEFPNLKLSIVSHMSDTSVQNYYLKSLLKIDPSTTLDEQLSTKYCEFLCQYFPSEVRDFVLKCNAFSILEICKKFKIYDACAVITAELSDFNNFKIYIINYFHEMSLKYADKIDDAEVFTKNSKFLCDIFKKYEQAQEKDIISQAVCDIVKDYAIPIYAAHEANVDLKPLQDGLHDFCIIGYSYVNFQQLLTIIVGEFGELSLGLIRSTLIELVNDYSYDIDTSGSLAQLFTENESEAYQKYVDNSTKGINYESTVCCECKKRLTESIELVIFPDGRIYHKACAPTGNQISGGSKNTNKKVFQRFKGFEDSLKVSNNLDVVRFKDENLHQVVIDPKKFSILQ